MSYAWGRRSLDRLATAHPLLRLLFERVIRRADLPSDLTVLCGHRTQAEQAAAVTARQTSAGNMVHEQASAAPARSAAPVSDPHRAQRWL